MERETGEEVLVKVAGRDLFRTHGFEESCRPNRPGGEEVQSGGLEARGKLRIGSHQGLPNRFVVVNL